MLDRSVADLLYHCLMVPYVSRSREVGQDVQPLTAPHYSGPAEWMCLGKSCGWERRSLAGLPEVVAHLAELKTSPPAVTGLKRACHSGPEGS